MKQKLSRTHNFNKRIKIEREALRIANLASRHWEGDNLFGLTDAAITVWIGSLSNKVDGKHLLILENCTRELARGAGLLADDSRCAVAEKKVPADFSELLKSFENTMNEMVAPS